MIYCNEGGQRSGRVTRIIEEYRGPMARQNLILRLPRRLTKFEENWDFDGRGLARDPGPTDHSIPPQISRKFSETILVYHEIIKPPNFQPKFRVKFDFV
jgi:hypothetical protein